MRAALAPLLLLASCATQPGPAGEAAHLTSNERHEGRAAPVVRHWGAMRQVLRDGRTEGRVDLAEVLGPHTVAVGALAALAAELTVICGAVHLAEVVDPESVQGLRIRTAVDGDQATLLILADVAQWSEHPLPAVSDLAALETSVRAIAAASDIDVSEPFPFRLEGVATTLSLHVLNHSCPVANPDGPEPWSFAGEGEVASLVGFHAEGAGGVLTHHGQQTHTHAFLPARGFSGHLDEVSFEPGARLYLPLR